VQVKQVDLGREAVDQALGKEAVHIDMEGIQREESRSPHRYAAHHLVGGPACCPSGNDLYSMARRNQEARKVPNIPADAFARGQW
jgi:hypothetical protein